MFTFSSDFQSAFITGYLIGMIIGIIGLFFLAIIPSRIAGNKGYSRVGFYWFGVGAFLPALIVSLCLRDRNAAPKQEGPAPSDQMTFDF